MKEFELFWLIFRRTHMNQFLIGFLVFYVISCLLMFLLDPSLTTLGDAFWFGFMLVMTIGFGDFTVISMPARIIAAMLAVYGIMIIAFICGVGSTYLLESLRSKRNESVSDMLWQLEHLDKLSDEQITSLQNRIQARHALAKKTSDKQETS